MPPGGFLRLAQNETEVLLFVRLLQEDATQILHDDHDSAVGKLIKVPVSGGLTGSLDGTDDERDRSRVAGDATRSPTV